MTDIASPRPASVFEDRDIDCEFALEPAFQRLADDAITAGWTEREVERALFNLGKAYLMSRIERARTNAAVAHARSKQASAAN